MNYISFEYWNDLEEGYRVALQKLSRCELSIGELKKTLSSLSKKKEKLIFFPKTKEEFVKTMGFQDFYESPEKEWEHEQEHCELVRKEGLTPKIGIIHLINDNKRDDKYGERARCALTIDNRHEVMENWSKEEYLSKSIRILKVSQPSKKDEEFIKSLEKLKENFKCKDISKSPPTSVHSELLKNPLYF